MTETIQLVEQHIIRENDPGSYDVVFIIESAAMGNSNLPDGWEPPTLFNQVFKLELVGDSICEFDTQYETYSCMKMP